jgi:hypothetical protein
MGPAGPKGSPGPGSDGGFHSDGSKPAVDAVIDTGGSPTAVAAVVGEDTNGLVRGVYGSGAGGVWGQGTAVGVQGDGGAWGIWGFGSRAGVLSNSDLAVEGHIYAHSFGRVAGMCEMPAAQTSVHCSFQPSFRGSTIPIVAVTPRSNPGSWYWVTSPDGDGFTLNLAAAPAGNVDFNFLVIGVDAYPFPG